MSDPERQKKLDELTREAQRLGLGYPKNPTDCGHPVAFTVRSAERELQVCAAHLDWARRELPFGVTITQTTASGYHCIVSGCRAPQQEAA